MPANRNQFGIQAALAATAGIACFVACSRVLMSVGVHGALIVVVLIPGAIGTFYGIAIARIRKRNTLLGSLKGCALGLSPTIALFLLSLLLGWAFGSRRHWLSQPTTWYLTDTILAVFPVLSCLWISAVVGAMFYVLSNRCE